MNAIKHGDFTGLADDYARHRPGYAPSVLRAAKGLLGVEPSRLDAADVGAGTGIWTRMLAGLGFRQLFAIEPNDDMRRCGERDSTGTSVRWRAGSGEATGLAEHSVDFLSMASSFHWVDFEQGCKEFARVLRPGGWFMALWNPRLIELNPLLMEIEAHLETLRPNIQRVSSGRSGITETLTDRLFASPHFSDVVYLEGRHTVHLTPEQYLGVWRSVNDLRVQLGESLFARFLDYVDERTRGLETIETTYLTRAWAAQTVAG